MSIKAKIQKMFEGVEDVRKGFFDKLADEIEDRIDRDEETEEDSIVLAAMSKLTKLGVNKGMQALTPVERDTILKVYRTEIARPWKDVSSLTGQSAGSTRKTASRGILKMRDLAKDPKRKDKLKDIASQLGSDKAIVDPWDVSNIYDPSLNAPDTDIYEGDIFKKATPKDIETRREQYKAHLPKTYKEWGTREGMDDGMADMFQKYMTARWGSRELNTSYGEEWMSRFKRHTAWSDSDGVGRKILKKIGYDTGE